MATEGTGYPGRKATGIGGTSLERVIHESENAAQDAVGIHESDTHPHSQYLRTANAFPFLYKWRAVFG